MERQAALLATGVAPTRTVGLLAVPAPTALLAGAAGGHRGDGHARQSSLVAREAEQAGEGPRAQASPLSVASLQACADVGQVREGQGCAGLHGLDQAPGQHVVAVPAETFLAAGHLAPAPLGRPCASRLKSTAPAQRTGPDLPRRCGTLGRIGLGVDLDALDVGQVPAHSADAVERGGVLRDDFAQRGLRVQACTRSRSVKSMFITSSRGRLIPPASAVGLAARSLPCENRLSMVLYEYGLDASGACRSGCGGECGLA